MRNKVWFILLAVLLVACNKVSYRKTAGGMPYKLYKGDGKKKVNPGNIVKYHVRYVLKRADKDTTYFETYGRLPIYAPVSFTPTGYDLSEIWSKMSVGDSVVATQMIDTFLNRNPEMAASARFKKGERLISYIKVLDAFEADSMQTADEQMEYKKYLEGEVKFMEKYLADKNIKAIKTPSGAFVQFINPGTGVPIDTGKYVTVNYTGSTMSGKKFDSNTDSAFHHPEPLGFITGRKGMIKGFDEAVQMMSPGSSAKVFIPSLLGYGGSPDPASGIKQFEHILFDIAIVDVKNAPPPPPQNRVKLDPTQPENYK